MQLETYCVGRVLSSRCRAKQASEASTPALLHERPTRSSCGSKSGCSWPSPFPEPHCSRRARSR